MVVSALVDGGAVMVHALVDGGDVVVCALVYGRPVVVVDATCARRRCLLNIDSCVGVPVCSMISIFAKYRLGPRWPTCRCE